MPKKSTKEERTKGAEKGRIEKEKYLKIKAFALEREEENFSKLFVIHEKKNWWKMIGNSAIIFHYEIAKRIGMTSRLVDDTDFEHRSKNGVVNISNIDVLGEKLEKNKIQYLEIKPEYIVFNLGQKSTVSDIERMKKTRELEWAKINKIILPENTFPLLYRSERQLLAKMNEITRRFEPNARDVFGKQLLVRSEWMVRNYSLTMNGYGIEIKEYLEKTIEHARWMTSEMAIVAELRLVEPERIFRALKDIETVKEDARECLLKIK